MSKKSIVFWLFGVAAAVCSAIKPTLSWSFNYNIGVFDNNSTYDIQTGLAEAKWTFAEYVSGYDFKWQYRIDGGDWVELPSSRVATSYAYAYISISETQTIEFQCYAQYVPPVQVVTNGVYHVNGVMRSMDTATTDAPKYVTPGVPIKAGEYTLTPVLNKIEMPIQISETEED